MAGQPSLAGAGAGAANVWTAFAFCGVKTLSSEPHDDPTSCCPSLKALLDPKPPGWRSSAVGGAAGGGGLRAAEAVLRSSRSLAARSIASFFLRAGAVGSYAGRGLLREAVEPPEAGTRRLGRLDAGRRVGRRLGLDIGMRDCPYPLLDMLRQG